MLKHLFSAIGTRAQYFEAYLNFKSTYPDVPIKKELLIIPPITEDEAFHKGIDYFVEIFLFYGILGGLSIYEMSNSIKHGKIQKAVIEKAQNDAETAVR